MLFNRPSLQYFLTAVSPLQAKKRQIIRNKLTIIRLTPIHKTNNQLQETSEYKKQTKKFQL